MNNKNFQSGFVYGFEIGSETPRSEHLTEQEKHIAERHAVDVIYESFVVTADQDYLASRLLAQSGLYRPFFWSAAQAIEKYLKALLLMNGDSILEFYGHPIKKLFNKAVKIEPHIANLNIEPHQEIQKNTDLSALIETYFLDNFIAELEEHGCPNNRYNASGVIYNIGHLFALDSLIFKLRCNICVPSIHESFRGVDSGLENSFQNMNYWFNMTNREHTVHKLSFVNSYSVTTLDFLIKHQQHLQYGVPLSWLKARMILPKR